MTGFGVGGPLMMVGWAYSPWVLGGRDLGLRPRL